MASNFKWTKKIEFRVTPPAANRDRSNDGFPLTATSTAKIPGGRSTLTQVFGGNASIRDVAQKSQMRKERPFPSVWPTGQIDVKRPCKSQFVSRSWKILAVAPGANNRSLIVFEMAESGAPR
jgi:hypothetical protein